MTVDGTRPEVIEDVLRSEMDAVATRHSNGKSVVDQLGRFAPAFGMIGTLMGLIITALLLSLIVPMRGFHWLGSGPLVWLGNISFGIYLWHYPLLILLQRTVLQDWTTPLLNTMALLVTLAGTLALASASYYLLENPLMSSNRS